MPAPVLALLGLLAAALVVVFALPVLGRREWAHGVPRRSLAVAAVLGLGTLLRRAFGGHRPGPAAVAADGGHRRRPGCLGGLRRAARALDPLARDAPGRHRRRRPGALAAAEPAHHPARPGPAGDRRCRCGVRLRDPRRRAGAARGWPRLRQRRRPSCTRSPTCCWPPSRVAVARPVAAPGRAGRGPVRWRDPRARSCWPCRTCCSRPEPLETRCEGMLALAVMLWTVGAWLPGDGAESDAGDAHWRERVAVLAPLAPLSAAAAVLLGSTVFDHRLSRGHPGGGRAAHRDRGGRRGDGPAGHAGHRAHPGRAGAQAHHHHRHPGEVVPRAGAELLGRDHRRRRARRRPLPDASVTPILGHDPQAARRHPVHRPAAPRRRPPPRRGAGLGGPQPGPAGHPRLPDLGQVRRAGATPRRR